VICTTLNQLIRYFSRDEENRLKMVSDKRSLNGSFIDEDMLQRDMDAQWPGCSLHFSKRLLTVIDNKDNTEVFLIKINMIKTLLYKLHISFMLFFGSIFLTTYSYAQNIANIKDTCNNCLYEVVQVNDCVLNTTIFLNMVTDIINEQVFQADSISEYIADSNYNYPWNFFIFDLTDNRFIFNVESVKLVVGHVYHFSAIRFRYSFSNICVIMPNYYAIFKKINCLDNFCNPQIILDGLSITDTKVSNSVKRRILNYRKFGKYIKECGYDGLMCK